MSGGGVRDKRDRCRKDRAPGSSDLAWRCPLRAWLIVAFCASPRGGVILPR
jgi:hypothetical protein